MMHHHDEVDKVQDDVGGGVALVVRGDNPVHSILPQLTNLASDNEMKNIQWI